MVSSSLNPLVDLIDCIPIIPPRQILTGIPSVFLVNSLFAKRETSLSFRYTKEFSSLQIDPNEIDRLNGLLCIFPPNLAGCRIVAKCVQRGYFFESPSVLVSQRTLTVPVVKWPDMMLKQPLLEIPDVATPCQVHRWKSFDSGLRLRVSQWTG